MSRLRGGSVPPSLRTASTGVSATRASSFRLRHESQRPPSTSDEAAATAAAIFRPAAEFAKSTPPNDESSISTSPFYADADTPSPKTVTWGGAEQRTSPIHIATDNTHEHTRAASDVPATVPPRKGPTALTDTQGLTSSVSLPGFAPSEGVLPAHKRARARRRARQGLHPTPLRPRARFGGGALGSGSSKLAAGLASRMNDIAASGKAPLRFVTSMDDDPHAAIAPSRRGPAAGRYAARSGLQASMSAPGLGTTSFAVGLDSDGAVGQRRKRPRQSYPASIVHGARAGGAPAAAGRGRGSRRTRGVGRGDIPKLDKFRPNLEVVKHGISPKVAATLRKDFVPKAKSDHGSVEAASPDSARGVHYAFAHPPLHGGDSSPTAAGRRDGRIVVHKLGRGQATHFPSSAQFLKTPGAGSAAQGSATSSMPSFGRMNGARLAAEIARWMVGMGDFKAQYTSVSVFLQVKLAEIEALTGNRSRPNMCRTAVAFGLLDLLIKKLSTFSDTLLPLRTELLQSVYPKEELRETKLPWELTAKPAAKLTTQETLEELFKCHTFYDLLADTRKKLEATLQELEEQRVFALKNERAVRHHAHIVGMKHTALKARVFYAWRIAALLAKERKRILANKLLAPLMPDITTRDVFAAWHRVTLLARQRRLAAQRRNKQSELETAQQALRHEQEAHLRTKAMLAEAQSKLAQSQRQTLLVKRTAQRLLEAQQQDLDAVLRALRMAAGMVESRLQSDMEEVKVMPDITVIEKALSLKDVHPDRCGQEPYTYAGNGSGNGGGGDYSDVDLAPFSIERAAEAERQGLDPMEWAKDDVAKLAQLKSDAAAQAGDEERKGVEAPAETDAQPSHAEVPRGNSKRDLHIETSFPALHASPSLRTPATVSSPDSPNIRAQLLSASPSPDSARAGWGAAHDTPGIEAGLSAAVARAAEAASADLAASPSTHVASVASPPAHIASVASPPTHVASVASPPTHVASVASPPTDRAVVPPAGKASNVPSPAPPPSPLSVPGVHRATSFIVGAPSPPLPTPKSTGKKKKGKKKGGKKKGGKKKRRKSVSSGAVTPTPLNRGAGQHFFGPDGQPTFDPEQLSQHPCVPKPPTPPPPGKAKPWQRYNAKEVAVAVTRMPVDVLLMRWVNYHLATAIVGGEAVDKRIHNFSSDFLDGEAIAILLHQLAPPYARDVRVVQAQDPSRRCELSVRQLRDLSPSPVNFVTAEHLASGDSNIVSALCARLFTTHHACSPPESYWGPLHDQVSRLEDAVADMDAQLADTQHLHAKRMQAFDNWSVLLETEVPAALRELSGEATTVAEASTNEDTPPASGGTEAGRQLQAGDESVGGVQHHEAALKSPAVTGKSLRTTVDTFASVLEETEGRVTSAVSQARHGHELYHETSARLVQFVWKAFESKLLNIQRKVLDEREERDLTEYTTIYPAKYKDLLDKYCKGKKHAEREVESMQAVLRKYRGELMRIFKYYCASGDGASISTMCISEYWTFLRQSQLAPDGFGDKNSARLDLIFGKAKQRIGLPDENEVNPERELIPRQWVETLLRVGVLLNENKRPEPSLTQSLTMVIEDYAVQHATQSNTEAFRAELQTLEVREVLKKHRVPLQRVFQHYCGVGKDVNGSSDSMDCDAFTKMLREAHIIDRHVTPLVVKHVFALTQLEEMFEDDCGGGGEDEMIYSEFQEGICAVALHKLSNSYVSVAKRIDDFIENHLLPRAKQAKPRRRARQRKASGSSPRSVRRRSIQLDAALELSSLAALANETPS